LALRALLTKIDDESSDILAAYGRSNFCMAIPSEIAGQKYISLTTFRKSGAGVRTPLWFAEADGKLCFMTRNDSGKYKRIRNNSKVLVAPCTMRARSQDLTSRPRPAFSLATNGLQPKDCSIASIGWQDFPFGAVRTSFWKLNSAGEVSSFRVVHVSGAPALITGN